MGTYLLNGGPIMATTRAGAFRTAKWFARHYGTTACITAQTRRGTRIELGCVRGNGKAWRRRSKRYEKRFDRSTWRAR